MRHALCATLLLESAAATDPIPKGVAIPLGGPDVPTVMAFPTDAGVVISPFAKPKEPIHTIKVAAKAVSFRYTKDGKRLTAVCSDRHLVIWDVSGKQVKKLKVVPFTWDPAETDFLFDEARGLGYLQGTKAGESIEVELP